MTAGFYLGEPLPASGPRYAQMLYTSYDPGDGRPGGWQVKEVDGAPTSQEVDALLAHIATRFDLKPALPSYPTPDQLEGRPARLTYRPIGAASAAYWHTVDAGRDATGRPGNVFAHVVLDRRPGEEASRFRPIELFTSAGWLRPYNTAEVAAAHVPAAVPSPGAGLDLASVVGFLLEDYDRQTLLRVLLDAVVGALAGGPSVILLVDDHASAGLWIAAVSRFLSPGAARRFSFSTHDAPEDVNAASDRGVHLIAVPRDRAPALRSVAGVVVIDSHEVPSIGDPGTEHRVESGPVPAHIASTLAEGVLTDEEMASRVLARQDGIAEALDDDGRRPLWALAAAVFEEPELAEFHREIAPTVADDAPPAADGVPWALDLLRRAEALAPSQSLPEALARLRTQAAHGASGRIAGRVLAMALADRGARTAQLVAMVPAVRSAITGPEPELRTAIAAAVATPDRDSARSELLLIGDLVHRLAEPRWVRDVALPQLVQAFAGHAGAGPQTWAVAARLTPDTVASLLRPVLAATDAGALAAMPIEVAEALYPDGRGGITEPANPDSTDLYLFPFAALVWLRTGRGDDATRALVVARAGDYAIGCLPGMLSDGDAAVLIGELMRQHLPEPGSLIGWFEYPDRTPPELSAELVLLPRLPKDTLSRLASAVNDDRIPEFVTTGAWLRLADTKAIRRPDDVLSAVKCAEAIERRIDADMAARLPADLARMAAVGVVVGELTGSLPRGSKLSEGLVSHLPRLGDSILDRIIELVVAGAIDVRWIAGAAVLAGHGAPSNDGAAAGLLDRWAPAWPEWVIDAISASGVPAAISVADVRDAAWESIKNVDADTAEQFFLSYHGRASDVVTRLVGRAAPYPGEPVAELPAHPDRADRGRINRFFNPKDI